MKKIAIAAVVGMVMLAIVSIVPLPSHAQVIQTTASLNNQNIFTRPNQFLLGAKFGPLPFASLPAESDGTQIYCSDCQQTNPCFGSGTGAMATGIAGAWSCNVTSGAPSVPVNSVQFNDGGLFGGSANLEWDNTNNILKIGPTGTGTITVGDFSALPAYLRTGGIVGGFPSLHTISSVIPPGFDHNSLAANVGINTYSATPGIYVAGLSVSTLSSNPYSVQAQTFMPSGTDGSESTNYSGDIYIEDATVTNSSLFGMSFAIWPAGGAGIYATGSFIDIGIPPSTPTGVVQAIGYEANAIFADSSTGTAIGIYIDPETSNSGIKGATRYAIKSDTTAQSAFNGVVGWQNTGLTAIDTGISRTAAGALALGNGTQGDYSGSLKLSTVVLGSATGGSEGAGTINVSGGYYVNGTILSTQGTLDAGSGLFGTAAINTVIEGTKATYAGHFTNLQVIASLGGTCTTVPQFNVFDGTSNTGTAVSATATTQTKGQATTQAETLTFSAGDQIGIYISTAGATCTTDSFAVSAQYSTP